MGLFSVANLSFLAVALVLILGARLVLSVVNWVLGSIWIFASLAFAVAMLAVAIFP